MYECSRYLFFYIILFAVANQNKISSILIPRALPSQNDRDLRRTQKIHQNNKCFLCPKLFCVYQKKKHNHTQPLAKYSSIHKRSECGNQQTKKSTPKAYITAEKMKEVIYLVWLFSIFLSFTLCDVSLSRLSYVHVNSNFYFKYHACP